jgi:ketosteroid isomerase-like protein
MSRPKIQTAHLVVSPEDTEAQFYEALREADIEKLMAVWSDDDEIVCVHPGGPRVIGASAIRASFEAIFAKGGIPVQLESGRRMLWLGTAVHSVVERVSIQTDQGERAGYVIATNVFVKTAQGWRLVSHHASPGSPQEAGEAAEFPSTLH